MVDKSRGECFELEVAHTVASYNHGSSLTMELVNYALQGLWRRIQVVAVELYGKASASLVVDSHVPASANAKVGALRNDVDKASIVDGIENVGGAIGRMVVDNDDIKLE